MKLRERLEDWLRGRRGDPAGRLRGLTGTSSPSGPVPAKPTRFVVSGRSPLMDAYRPVEWLPIDPRIRLWRDTGALLAVFALAVALFQWLPRPEQAVLGETGAPTQTLGEPQTTEPGAGAEPSSSSTQALPTLAPSASASATAVAPTPTPRATPRVTPRPSIRPKPTPAPTPQQPSPSPSPSEAPSPSPSEPPSPSPSDSPAPSDSPIPSESPAPPSESPAPPSESPGP